MERTNEEWAAMYDVTVQGYQDDYQKLQDQLEELNNDIFNYKEALRQIAYGFYKAEEMTQEKADELGVDREELLEMAYENMRESAEFVLKHKAVRTR
mgnify:CR=1 FL=1